MDNRTAFTNLPFPDGWRPNRKHRHRRAGLPISPDNTLYKADSRRPDDSLFPSGRTDRHSI